MIIQKISKIKKLGIFSDFTWNAAPAIFGRYNLIYGWNGSGKTTLSNFFTGLPTGSMTDWPDLEYEIETVTGVIKSGQAFTPKIRVFNRDYAANNVHTISKKAKPIFILGAENKKIADEIAADEAILTAKTEKVNQLEDEFERSSIRKNEVFTAIAKTIGLNTSGLATRTYRRPNAEADFAALSGKMPLDESSVTASSMELRQLEKSNVPEVSLSQLSLGEEQKELGDFLIALISIGTDLNSQTVESKIIERLKQNSDIARWVETGIALHSAHASSTCEFCDQVLPAQRIEVLTAHFNEADKKLKDEIDNLLRLIAQAESYINTLQPPDKANLYDELQITYQEAVESLAVAKTSLLEQLKTFRAAMETKKTKTTESIALSITLENSDLISTIDLLNTEIAKHNKKTSNFKAAKDTAQKKLEAHYLSTVYDDVKSLEKKVEDCKVEINELNNGNSQIPGDIGIIGLKERVKGNRAAISSSHKGCEEINSALKTFLGRDELQFEVEAEGYILMRGNIIADNLSEGEKTAIGFVHFVVHLKDQGFDPANGIVVVDDPISSLDSNSTFQAFAFLKNSVKDAKQVFLMTHNFDFLRLLISWIEKSRQKSGYYMIKNTYSPSGERLATIAELDKLLHKHESEYHYLFKLLYTFQSDGTIESAYHVPNIARKVLDTFLMFRVPNGERSYTKMETLKPHFDENKLTAIYKFTNDQSHITGKGFDPSLVAETQKNVKFLLEMINAVFPEHYKILVESISG